MVLAHRRTAFLAFWTTPDPNKPKWGPNCAVDASVRSSHARASYRNIISTPHFGLSSGKLEILASKPKNIPGSKNMTFSYISLNQEHQQGWGGLGFRMMAGWVGGAGGQACTCLQALNIATGSSWVGLESPDRLKLERGL